MSYFANKSRNRRERVRYDFRRVNVSKRAWQRVRGNSVVNAVAKRSPWTFSSHLWVVFETSPLMSRHRHRSGGAAGFNKSLASAATKGCHRKFLCLEDRAVGSRRVVARNASFRIYLSFILSFLFLFSPSLCLPCPSLSGLPFFRLL